MSIARLVLVALFVVIIARPASARTWYDDAELIVNLGPSTLDPTNENATTRVEYNTGRLLGIGVNWRVGGTGLRLGVEVDLNAAKVETIGFRNTDSEAYADVFLLPVATSHRSAVIHARDQIISADDELNSDDEDDITAAMRQAISIADGAFLDGLLVHLSRPRVVEYYGTQILLERVIAGRVETRIGVLATTALINAEITRLQEADSGLSDSDAQEQAEMNVRMEVTPQAVTEIRDEVSDTDRMEAESGARMSVGNATAGEDEVAFSINRGGDGNDLALSAFINAYYDFFPTSEIYPYIGGGVGFAWNRAEDSLIRTRWNVQRATGGPVELGSFGNTSTFGRVSAQTTRRGGSSSISFAANAQVGLRYRFSENLVLDAGWRALWIEDIGNEFEDSETLQQIRLGAAMRF